jgi:hypothetical protein
MDRIALAMLYTPVAVGLTVGLGIRLIQLAVERIRGQRFSRTVGWPATSAWALGFAIAAFAVAGAMSIGIFVLPFAVIVYGVAAWRCRALPEGAIGAGLGAGLAILVIGLMNWPRCGALSLPFGIGAHTYSFTGCGGITGISWLPLTAALVVASVAGQVLMARRISDGVRGVPSFRPQ